MPFSLICSIHEYSNNLSPHLYRAHMLIHQLNSETSARFGQINVGGVVRVYRCEQSVSLQVYSCGKLQMWCWGKGEEVNWATMSCWGLWSGRQIKTINSTWIKPLTAVCYVMPTINWLEWIWNYWCWEKFFLKPQLEVKYLHEIVMNLCCSCFTWMIHVCGCCLHIGAGDRRFFLFCFVVFCRLEQQERERQERERQERERQERERLEKERLERERQAAAGLKTSSGWSDIHLVIDFSCFLIWPLIFWFVRRLSTDLLKVHIQ